MNKKGLDVLGVFLSAAGGAAMFFAIGRLVDAKPAGEAVAQVPKTDPEVARLQRDLAALQARVAQVEARPDFNSVLSDQALRQQLAAVVEEAKGPATMGPRPAAPGSDNWRRDTVNRFRQDYGKLVEEALAAMKVEGPELDKARSELQAYFEPVEDHLRKLEAREVSAPPRVNHLLAPQLAGMLERMEKAVSPEAFKAFDAWRKAPAGTLAWGQGKGDFFLAGEDYAQYHIDRSVNMNWPLLKSSLDALWGEARVGEEQRKKLEPLFKAHLQQVFTDLQKDDSPTASLVSQKALARSKQATEMLEVAMGQVVKKDVVERFRKWKASPGNRCCYYFGVPFKPAEGRPAGASG